MTDLDQELDDFLKSSDDEMFLDLSGDKENEAPESEDETEKLQKQIQALQAQLELKKSTKRKNSSPEVIQPKVKAAKIEVSQPESGYASQVSSQKPVIPASGPVKCSMMAPVTKSIKQKDKIQSDLKIKSTITHQETVYSNLKYTNVVTEKTEFTKQVSGLEYKALHQIPPVFENAEESKRSRSAPENFFTIAVIVSFDSKTSANGNNFILCKISNLFNCPETSTLFLFGNAATSLSRKVNQAQLIAITHPKILPQKLQNDAKWKNKDLQKNTVALSITDPKNYIILGNQCLDFGYCNGQNWTTSKNGQITKSNHPTKCKNFINLSLNNLCSYHLSQSSKKIISNRGIFNSTAKPVVPSDIKQAKNLQKTMIKNYNKNEQTFTISKKMSKTLGLGDAGQNITINQHSENTFSNPKNSSSQMSIELKQDDKTGKIIGGSSQFNKALNKVTPGSKMFKEHLKQKTKLEQLAIASQQKDVKSAVKNDLSILNSINRVTEKQKLAQNYELKGSDLRSAAKEKAAEMIKNNVKNNDRISKILQRVNANRKILTPVKKNKTASSQNSDSVKDYTDLINKKSKFEGKKSLEEQKQMDLYFKVLEKRDEKLLKDLSTHSEDSSVQICHTCKHRDI